MAITNTGVYYDRSTVNGMSYTLSDFVVGAGTNRLLVVLVSLIRGNENGVTVSSVTFGGVGMTAGVEQTGTSTSRSYYVGLWYLVNPSVSTANIVATTSNTMAGAIVAAVALYGVDQTSPIHSSSVTSQTGDRVTLGNGGDLSFFIVASNANNNPTWTWTADIGSVTEIYDLNNGVSDNGEIAGTAGGGGAGNRDGAATWWGMPPPTQEEYANVRGGYVRQVQGTPPPGAPPPPP